MCVSEHARSAAHVETVSQALLMLNSDLVMQSAAGFADRVLAGSADDDRRLSRMYAVAFGREPTDDERRADRAFLAGVMNSRPAASDPAKDQRQAWTTLCHVVLAANEFVYVR